MRRALSLFLIFVFGLSVFALPAEAQSASLYLSPSSNSYTVGNTFSVDVKINTGGQSINAAQGTLVFDTNAFEVTGTSKKGSVFTLWIQDISVSNSAGTITFSGGLPSPGFSGSAGKLFTIILKVKTSGVGRITWSSGAVLVNDGRGTNILASMEGGGYTLNPLITIPSAPSPAALGGRPSAPLVTSLTHPDEDKWYSNSNPVFKWSLPEDVSHISYSLTQGPDTNPKIVIVDPRTKASFDDVDDGIWYFHINFKNNIGWGALTHRKVLIDTESPEPFAIKFIDDDDLTNPRPAISLTVQDSLSGIFQYEISINGGDKETVLQETLLAGENVHRLSLQPPGDHTIVVGAYDEAGNYTIDVRKFTIESIEPPLIDEYTQVIDSGGTLIIKGNFLPAGTVRVYVQKEGEDAMWKEVKSNKEGGWVYVHARTIERGVYRIWVEGIDTRGAQSYPSEKIHIAVKVPALLGIGKLAVDYLSVVVSLIAIFVLIIGAALFGWYRMTAWERAIGIWSKKLRREVHEADDSVQKACYALYDELSEQLEAFEHVKTKRQLTREEKRMVKQFKKALDVAERYISKEIKDVKKELDQ